LGDKLEEALIERVRTVSWTPEAKVQTLLSYRATENLWHSLPAAGSEVDDAYWRAIRWWDVRGNAKQVSAAIPRLLSVGRARVALRAIAGCQEPISSNLIIEVLENVVKQSDDESVDRNDRTHFQYSVEQAFGRLDKAGDISDDVMTGLEWQYLQALDDSRRPPIKLHRRMALDPDFFVQVIRAIYRPEEGFSPEEPPPENMQSAVSIASQAYRLLGSWDVVPGAEGQTVDGEKLSVWVKQAREACAAIGRGRVGDDAIGKVLAHSPHDPDGTWPIREVRDVIETIPVSAISSGIHSGLINKQGATMRAYLEGGVLEERKAEQYRGWARAISSKWPRTASILMGIALDYERDARRENEEAQLRAL
jgi:hypothetical protein